jgi:Fe-S cluster assembly protein SufD
MIIKIPKSDSQAHHIIQTDIDYNMQWHVQPYAQLKLIHEQRCNSERVTTRMKFILEEGAQLELVPLIFEGQETTLHIDLELHYRSRAVVKGAYAINKTQKGIIRVTQSHQKAASESHVTINGVATDAAFIDYAGIITIDTHASKSVASQENKSMLWSQKARAQSIPSLEVKTNDVQCAHGSAIGYLNKEHIWYAQTRGMSAVQAQKLLLKSFFCQTLPDSIDNKIIEELTNKIIGSKEQ